VQYACKIQCERKKLLQQSPGKTCHAKNERWKNYSLTENPFSGLSPPQSLVIIAPDTFIPALQPLVRHKNESGMPTVAVSISSIAAFYQTGDNPESIKKAIQYAHENLSTNVFTKSSDKSERKIFGRSQTLTTASPGIVTVL
jgi:hypothetical protein